MNERNTMEDAVYKELYYSLFNSLTDTIISLEHEIERLKQIQRDAEERYIEASAEADD